MTTVAYGRQAYSEAVEPQITAAEFKRRLRAGRELVGIRSHKAAAAMIDGRGFSASNLRAMERGDRPCYRSYLVAIADALGLPPAWFTVDLWEAVNEAAKTQLDPGEAFERELEATDPSDGTRGDSTEQDEDDQDDQDQPGEGLG